MPIYELTGNHLHLHPTGDSRGMMTLHSRIKKVNEKKNFGKPASAYSDSYIQTLSRPGLMVDQYKVELLNVFKS